ncbi:MAG: GMC family oxidoreductase, partial [Pseudomonadota bacterium]
DVVDADICIVGGGAAGISMALSLAGGPLKVALFESGGIDYEEAAQALYAGPNLGMPTTELELQRLRFLGGATNHWAGNCMRLDAIDFEARPGVPHSGWPIGLKDVEPFYPRAQELTETPADGPYESAARRAEVGVAPLDLDPEKMRSFLYAESPPTAFGYAYEDQLRAAENVAVYLHANALEVETDDRAARVERIAMGCIDGPRFSATARRYVLAAGGIETPRLLLLSNRVAPAGLGNENDLVGRYFMDHYSFRPAFRMLLPDDGASLRLYAEAHDVEGGVVRGAVAASEALLRREELPNFAFFVFTSDGKSPGQLSAEAIRRSLGRGEAPDRLAHHIGNLATDLDGLTNEIYATATGSRDHLIARTWLTPWIVCETVPNPESRVRLVEERDEVFGQNRIGLDMRLTEADLRVNKRATEVFAAEMSRLGYGRVWSELLLDDATWTEPMPHGKHHCGTTRMSADPKTGVVDADCRVHGVSNLHIASSSVFPTHGFATPTLTIVALALRLADHLVEEAEGGRL